jgi:hypothetical protein
LGFGSFVDTTCGFDTTLQLSANGLSAPGDSNGNMIQIVTGPARCDVLGKREVHLTQHPRSDDRYGNR